MPDIVPLSLHDPEDWGAEAGVAQLDVVYDGDSSLTPASWVSIAWTDVHHDSDVIRLTLEETALLRDRLDYLLGGGEASA